AVVAGLGSAWAAHAAGFSPALGSFLAGIFLGGSSFATQVRTDISSLRVVLLTLFFGAAGMVANPYWMLLHAHWILLATASLVVLKTLVIWCVLRLAGQSHVNALASGLCLAQIGEFAFVLGSIGKSGGIISDITYELLVSTTIAALVITAYLVPAAPHLARWVINKLGWRDLPPRRTDESTANWEPSIVIMGFGATGRLVVETLHEHCEETLVIALNRRLHQQAQEKGFRCCVGDPTQFEVLQHAQMESARVVIVTLPTRSDTLLALDHLRRLVPQAHLIVRSRLDEHRREFQRSGASQVISDEQEVANALASLALERIVQP
ncbi:MAG: NAD-binding protein, partial [Pirellulales bacterium]|nr:NAD-binding protein [Pirellulales bacterium]